MENSSNEPVQMVHRSHSWDVHGIFIISTGGWFVHQEYTQQNWSSWWVRTIYFLYLTWMNTWIFFKMVGKSQNMFPNGDSITVESNQTDLKYVKHREKIMRKAIGTWSTRHHQEFRCRTLEEWTTVVCFGDLKVAPLATWSVSNNRGGPPKSSIIGRVFHYNPFW